VAANLPALADQLGSDDERRACLEKHDARHPLPGFLRADDLTLLDQSAREETQFTPSLWHLWNPTAWENAG
jgi:hypothetical protein